MDLRELERNSIRAFVQSAADEGYLSGRVLDYGCGKQPYRDIVEAAGGVYTGVDRVGWPANVSGEDLGPSLGPKHIFNAVLCTQVVQYVEEPEEFFWPFRDHLTRPGHLVLTYPTNWPEVEPEDLHRLTKAGMERLLTEAGFTIVRHERRAMVRAVHTGSALAKGLEGGIFPDHFALGYGVIARA